MAWTIEQTIPIIIQTLVAAGTLSLAFVAWSQARTGLKRELADVVYGPLLLGTSRMSDPAHALDSGFVYTWRNIRENHTFLSHRMPRSLFHECNKLEEMCVRIEGGLHGLSLNVESEAIGNAVRRLAGVSGDRGHWEGSIWIHGEAVGPLRVNLLHLWVRGEDLEEYARAKAREMADWYYDVRLSGRTTSKKREHAIKCADTVFSALEANQGALALRAVAREAASRSERLTETLRNRMRGRIRL